MVRKDMKACSLVVRLTLKQFTTAIRTAVVVAMVNRCDRLHDHSLMKQEAMHTEASLGTSHSMKKSFTRYLLTVSALRALLAGLMSRRYCSRKVKEHFEP